MIRRAPERSLPSPLRRHPPGSRKGTGDLRRGCGQDRTDLRAPGARSMESYHTGNNHSSLEQTEKILKENEKKAIIFVNLIDFDMIDGRQEKRRRLRQGPGRLRRLPPQDHGHHASRRYAYHHRRPWVRSHHALAPITPGNSYPLSASPSPSARALPWA